MDRAIEMRANAAKDLHMALQTPASKHALEADE